MGRDEVKVLLGYSQELFSRCSVGQLKRDLSWELDWKLAFNLPLHAARSDMFIKHEFE